MDSKMPAQTMKIAPASGELRGHGHEGLSFMSEDTVAPGYCECGCGTWIGFWERSRGDIKKGQPKRFARGHNSHSIVTCPVKRFWKYVDTETSPDGCWEWQGTTTDLGYGQWWFEGRLVKAHRHSYAMANGPIPDGLFVCHSCDNPPCCNPEHLWLGTPADNARDMARKGRAPRGTSVPTARLTPDRVRELRELCETHSLAEVARRFGIDPHTARSARDGETWGWVK